MVRSIEEANSIIPELERIFGKVSELNEKSVCLTKDLQSLFDIWGEQIRDEKNPDHFFYTEKASKREAMSKDIQKELGKIREFGGVVKDVHKGLVDFYFEREGEAIYLCWKLGEDRIKHWHYARSGFTGRRPIEELNQAASMG